jgi:hypothetical protein
MFDPARKQFSHPTQLDPNIILGMQPNYTPSLAV